MMVTMLNVSLMESHDEFIEIHMRDAAKMTLDDVGDSKPYLADDETKRASEYEINCIDAGKTKIKVNPLLFC